MKKKSDYLYIYIGSAICLQGVSWVAAPCCICPLYGRGYDYFCRGTTSLGWWLFAFDVLPGVLNLLNFCISLWLLLSIHVLKRLTVKRGSAPHSTLIFACLGSLNQALLAIQFLFSYTQPIETDHDGHKDVATWIMYNVAMALGFWFATLALLNTSLVWLEIYQATSRLSAKGTANISQYRYVLLAYYLLFLTLLVVLGELAIFFKKNIKRAAELTH